MGMMFFRKPQFLGCRMLRVILALFWLFGLFFGCMLSLLADDCLSPLLLTAFKSGLSLASFLPALLLPLLFTVIFIYFSFVVYQHSPINTILTMLTKHNIIHS